MAHTRRDSRILALAQQMRVARLLREKLTKSFAFLNIQHQTTAAVITYDKTVLVLRGPLHVVVCDQSFLNTAFHPMHVPCVPVMHARQDSRSPALVLRMPEPCRFSNRTK